MLTFITGEVLPMLPVIMASGADLLVDQIRNFVAPFVLLVISCVALTFLFKRQFMDMLVFVIVGIAVAAIFYAPGIITSLGKSAGEANQSISWQ